MKLTEIGAKWYDRVMYTIAVILTAKIFYLLLIGYGLWQIKDVVVQ